MSTTNHPDDDSGDVQQPAGGSTPPSLVSELRTTAEQLARSAGTVALDGRRNSEALLDPETIDTKSSVTDLVTAFDRAAEAAIVDWLRLHRPTDAIVGEEGTSVDGTSGLEWHIDPIDGTTNFVYDQPSWSCSIAVRSSTGTLAGAVFAPVLDEMFSAGANQGATRNGSPIVVSDLDEIGLALVATGFSFRPERRSVQAAVVAGLISEVRDIRRLGSAALDLCFVACGRVDAYFEAGLNSWDMLAGELIAIEAGAVSSDFAGGPVVPNELVVSTPRIHRSLCGLLANG